MLSTVLLIIAGILFIVTFGIHSFIITSSHFDRPMYTRHPILSLIPAVSGFVLATICWTLLLDWHWLLVFIANIGAVYIIGPGLTKSVLVRFATGKGLGDDMLYAFTGAMICFIIGILTHKPSQEDFENSFNYKKQKYHDELISVHCFSNYINEDNCIKFFERYF